jgi:cell division protein FtsI/penicillin-binding protein 2
MSSYYQKKVKKRSIFLSFCFVLWAGIIVIRLVQLQVVDHVRLKAEAIKQNQDKKDIIPQRGTIYDRNMTILARSVPGLSVFLDPLEGQSASEQWSTAKKVGYMLGLSADKLNAIKGQIKKQAPFIWIERKIEENEANRIDKMNLNGIYLMEENKRFYPQGKRAAHVLGRVNIDEEGVSGIEYRFNEVLQGKKGQGLVLRDAKRRRYNFETISVPEDGMDLVLTLDETIQYIAEQELQKAVVQTRAQWGTVIVSLPQTGDILALANCPTYDLNHPPDPPTSLDRNKAIHHTYDPGSTFKIVTFSAAIENNSVPFTETFDCSKGYVVYAGNTFLDHERMGILSFPQVFIHSSNVGTIYIGLRIGEKNLFRAIEHFGFGQRTGIDLPAEERGLLNPLDRWTKISVASHSIGYEISVTPLQMLQALNVIANRGVKVPPRIVKNIHDSGSGLPVSPLSYEKVISEGTASQIKTFMKKVVSEGTGTTAQIPGYTVFGKTGTAQKYDREAKAYLSSAHIASFVGFVEKEQPLFSIIVVVDDPQGLYYGGQVAAPVFREIAAKTLRYLGVPPEKKTGEILIAAHTGRQNDE